MAKDDIDDTPPELGADFFKDAVLTRPGESLLDTVRGARRPWPGIPDDGRYGERGYRAYHCLAEVHHRYSWYPSQCSRKAVTDDGLCTQHQREKDRWDNR